MRYCVLLACLLGIGLVAGAAAQSNSSSPAVPLASAAKNCSVVTEVKHIAELLARHPFGWWLWFYNGSYAYKLAKTISNDNLITLAIFAAVVSAFGASVASGAVGYFLGTLSVPSSQQKDRSPLFASSQPAYFPARYQQDDFSSMKYVDTGNMENYMDFVDPGNNANMENYMDDVGTSYTKNGGEKSNMDKIYKGDEGFMGENDRAYKHPQPAPRTSKVASDNSVSAKYDSHKHESKP